MHSRYAYVLTRSHLNRLQNIDSHRCVRCAKIFEEDDVIVTSTSMRYCYDCATTINLVTGNVRKDLHNDEFIPNVLRHVNSIGKKLMINDHVCGLAMLLITTAFDNTNYISKNKIGLACAAINLACKINKQIISNDDVLPISKYALRKNTNLLQKSLTDTDIYALSERIYGLMH